MNCQVALWIWFHQLLKRSFLFFCSSCWDMNDNAAIWWVIKGPVLASIMVRHRPSSAIHGSADLQFSGKMIPAVCSMKAEYCSQCLVSTLGTESKSQNTEWVSESFITEQQVSNIFWPIWELDWYEPVTIIKSTENKSMHPDSWLGLLAIDLPTGVDG